MMGWAKFYVKENELLVPSEIGVCPIHKQRYKDVRDIWYYDIFQTCVSDKQCGFIYTIQKRVFLGKKECCVIVPKDNVF